MMMEGTVFLFIPNIIGYVRVVLLMVSAYVMLTHPWLACTLHLSNVLLDEVDGIAARRLNQCSMFGAVFDLVTDVCTSLCLNIVLTHLYPSYLYLFQMLIVLDISSHWIQMYSSLTRGSGSHKLNDNPVLRFYYTPLVLSVFCIGNAVFFSSLYSLYFTPGFIVSLFGYEVGVWSLVAVLSFPISFLKQCISVIQLVVACQNIAALDHDTIHQRAQASSKSKTS